MKENRNTNMNHEARGTGARRRFAKRLFSMLMVVSLLCNAFGFVVDDGAVRQMGINRPASAEDIEIHANAAGAGYESGELELDAGALDAYDDSLGDVGDLDISQDIASNFAGDENVYTYSIDGETRLVLSDLVKQLKLPIKNMKLVENVSLLGNEKDPTIDMSLFITVVAVEDDYLIFLKPKFADAKLAVYTADRVFTIRLVNDMTLGLEDVRKAALKLELDPSTYQSVFRYDFGHEPARIRLSKLLDRVGLSINLKSVQDVGVLERNGDEGGTLAIERVKGDYVISAIKRFAEIDLAVFTADNIYTVALLNGEPAETGASGGPSAGAQEQTEVGDDGELEIDLSDSQDIEFDGEPFEPDAQLELDQIDGNLDELDIDVLPDLVSEPVPAAEPEGEPATESEPGQAPAVEPAAQPEDEPASEPEDQPEQELAVEPAAQPEGEPVSEPEGEPGQEPAVEPAAQPEDEPATEPEDEPDQTPATEPEQEPAIELVTEPEQEPAVNPDDETTAEPGQVEASLPEPETEPGQAEVSDEPPVTEPESAPQDEPAAPAVAYPAVEFNARASGVNVSVSAGEGAFPEGTTMVVRRVWDADTLSDIRESVADDFTKVRRVQAVDIAFYDAAGNEIEPLIPISVVISVSGINEDQSALVLHVDDTGEKEVVAQTDAGSEGGRTNLSVEMPASDAVQTEVGKDASEPSAAASSGAENGAIPDNVMDDLPPEEVILPEQTEVDLDIPEGDGQVELEFDADAFSMYVVVVTETISTHYIDASGHTWAVEVGYGPEAGIPSGAQLEVSELTGEAAEAYASQAAEALEVTSNQIAYTKTLDIAIVKDGEEVHPSRPVSVSIRLLDAPSANENTSVSVLHFGDEVEPVSCALDGETVAFETDGFSVYVVVYTAQEVSLHEVYRINDGETVKLSDILDDLQIPKGENGAVYSISDVQDVACDPASTTLTVTAEDHDWSIKAVGAFIDPVTLKLRVGENTEIEIAITCPERIPLTITAADATKVYDGTALTEPGYTVTAGSLAKGDTIVSVTVTGTKTNVDGDDGANVPSAAIIRNAAGEDVTTSYNITYVPGTLTITPKPVTITAYSYEKVYDGLPLSDDGNEGYSCTELAAGDAVQVVRFSGERTLVGGANLGENVPSGAIIIRTVGETDVTGNYEITYVNGDLKVTPRSITIRADSDSKAYDGQKLEKETYSITDGSLAEGDSIAEVTFTVKKQGTDEATEAIEIGAYDNVPSDAVIKNANGEVVTEIKNEAGDVIQDSCYNITYENGTLEIHAGDVTLTANSGIKVYNNGQTQTVSGFTTSLSGLTEQDFPGVSASGSGAGNSGSVESYPVEFTGVTVGQTKDELGKYTVEALQEGTLIVTPEAPVVKAYKDAKFNGNLAKYEITFNPQGRTLNGGNDLVLKDNFNVKEAIVNGVKVDFNSQSIIYSSVQTYPVVSYDFSGNTGTFTIPDRTPVTITYTTRVSGAAGEEVTFTDSVQLGRMLNGRFEDLYDTSSGVHKETLTPTGTDTEGDSGVYTLKLYTYAENNMQTGLEGAVYRLLDSNQRPITYKTGADVGKDVTFETDANGIAVISLYETDNGDVIQALHKNTLYYLEMVKAPAPVDKGDGKFTYFQKDTTLYNFVISDNPSYDGGVDVNGTQIYQFYNGDTLKVKCYTAEPGVKVKLRPVGNAASLDTKNSPYVFKVLNNTGSWTSQDISLVLQVYNNAEDRWEDVETHSFNRDNAWGVVSFTSQLTPSSEYQVIQRGDEPPAGSGIAHTAKWSVDSYYSNGTMQENTGSAFTYDPDEAYSFNIVCDDEYAQHKLTLVVMNEETGKRIKGATFNVTNVVPVEGGPAFSYAPESTVEGLVTIEKNTTTQNYSENTLYSITQTGAPDGYIPSTDVIYFYFSSEPAEGESRWTPKEEDGLPSGASAIDLSQTYGSVTVYNPTEKVKVPVVVTWNIDGVTDWPNGVDHVKVGLYQTVNGNTTPVEDDETGDDLTLHLTSGKFYDNSVFLPARVTVRDEGTGEDVVYPVEYYSVKVEGIYSAEDESNPDNNITADYYTDCDTVSGTGWHVVKIQNAVKITVVKKWYKLGGTEPDEPSHDNVAFSLYRTTRESERLRAVIERDELAEFLDTNKAAKVELESGMGILSGSEGWTRTIPNLPRYNDAGKPYYYFVLENEESMPVNHEDKYVIAAAEEGEDRELTIRNIQTLTTVTITAQDQEKYFGQADPDYVFDVTVADPAITEDDITGPAYDEEEHCYIVRIKNDPVYFSVSRDEGETVNEDPGYVIKLEGNEDQGDYRVVLKKGKLIIKPAVVIVTPKQDAKKTYGEADPVLVSLTYEDGTPFDNTDNDDPGKTKIDYDVIRTPGENVKVEGYSFEVTAEPSQKDGNYLVECANDGNGLLTIVPKKVTVRAKDQRKIYGNADPNWEDIENIIDQEALDLVQGDTVSLISCAFTRDEGEGVTEEGYTINATCGAGTFDHYNDSDGKTWYRQGNYDVTFENAGKLFIDARKVTVKPRNLTKFYGDADPDWSDLENVIDLSVLDLVEGDTVSMISCAFEREEGENVKENGEGYTIRAMCGEGTFDQYDDSDGKTWFKQDNYDVSFETGTLTIKPAVLTIALNNQVKALGDEHEPLLDADDGTGWQYSENDSLTKTHLENADSSITWTYAYQNAHSTSEADAKKQIVFKVSRKPGEAAGMYSITASCVTADSNYDVTFTNGTLTILALYDVSVAQETYDDVASNANNPPYRYTAVLGGDFSGYTGNGFVEGVYKAGENEGFTLPDSSSIEPNRKALKVPAGAKLTVTQTGLDSSADPTGRYHELDYTTDRFINSEEYSQDTDNSIVIDPVVEQVYDMKFVHTRRSLPLEARVTEDDSSEEQYTPLEPSGAVGIAYDEAGVPVDYQVIDESFARAMEDQILYQIPEKKYSPFDHASLYKKDGNVIPRVTAVRFDGTNLVWQYKTAEMTDYEDIGEATLVLFYMPKYVCQVPVAEGEPEKFYSLNDAMDYIQRQIDANAEYVNELVEVAKEAARAACPEGASEKEIKQAVDAAELQARIENRTEATIEMLIDYTIPDSDRVTVPFECNLTLTTVDGHDTHTIGRNSKFTQNGMFNVVGAMTMNNIILSGNNVNAAKALVTVTGANASLNVTDQATLKNASGADEGSAIYVSNGVATISGTLSDNTAANGGAVYVAGGNVQIEGNLTRNTATNGGAVYVAGGTVDINSAIQGHSASYGGAAYVTGGILNINSALTANRASSGGGAVFMNNGKANVNSTLSGNRAPNGGAIYMERGTVNVVDGSVINDNTAANHGGAVYTVGGNFNMTGGNVSTNVATSGDGGAIWCGGGASVTVSGGTVSGNRASSGNGGAIYQSAGTVTLNNTTVTENNKTVETDRAKLNGENTAIKGSAMYIAAGTANLSNCTITGNKATQKGAVYVADASVKLYFLGNVTIRDNKDSTGTSSNNKGNNVYLYLDTGSPNATNVINCSGLGNSAAVYLYFDDCCKDTLGQACQEFGNYSEASYLYKFSNENSNSNLVGYGYNKKLIWSRGISYKVYSLESGFPPATATQKASGTYYPHTLNNPNIYDMVMEMQELNSTFKTNVAGLSYAYTYNSNASDFAQYITAVNWKPLSNKWGYVPHNDKTAISDVATLNIYYIKSAYISLTNNSPYTLKINPLTVMGKTAVDDGYGYPTAINYVTQDTLIPIADTDAVIAKVGQNVIKFIDDDGNIVLPSNTSVKLLFPGAIGANIAWRLQGVFEGAAASTATTQVTYTLNGTLQPLTTTDEGDNKKVDLSGTMPNADGTCEILFGEATPICQVYGLDETQKHLCASFTEAMAYIQDPDNDPDTDDHLEIKVKKTIASQKQDEVYYTNSDGVVVYYGKDGVIPTAVTGSEIPFTTDEGDEITVPGATIEMLIDYGQDADDQMVIPEGYHIVLKTASNFKGKDATRATISRDGIADAAIAAGEGSEDIYEGGDLTKWEEMPTLTVRNIIFDGKALATSSNGGALRASNYIVTLDHCDFKGYTASRGGAVYANWGYLTVDGCNFSDCTTSYTGSSKNPKTGGGGLWTTAKVLKVLNSTFIRCDCIKGNTQGGAIFHNIRGGAGTNPIYDGSSAKFPDLYSYGTVTNIESCTFTSCYALNGSGGAVESDALTINLKNCFFDDCYSDKGGANGGALNVYTNDNVNVNNLKSKLTLKGCTFNNCRTIKNNATTGGAIRTLTRALVMEKYENKEAQTQKRNSFVNCRSTTGGAIHFSNTVLFVKIADADFDQCTASFANSNGSMTGTGGAVNVSASELVIDNSLFTNCEAVNHGGVKQGESGKTVVTNSSFENCKATGSAGGALYTSGSTLSIKGHYTVVNADGETENHKTFENCSASGDGGAVYNTGTSTFTDCTFENCTSGVAGGAARLNNGTVSGGSVEHCVAQTNGGGMYFSGTATLKDGVEFAYNHVKNATGGGGAVYCGNTMNFTGGGIHDSYAAMGGGVYANAAFNLNGGTIRNCYAPKGGGVYSNGNMTVSTNGENGEAIKDCKANYYTVNSDGSATPDTIYYAGNEGGAIYKKGGKLVISTAGVVIDGCQAYDGGGIYINTNSTENAISNGTISGNTAVNNGGGVYINNGTLAYSGGTIKGNTAANYGGGIYKKAGGTFNMSGSAMIGGADTGDANKAVKGAGVFVVDGQTMTMTGGSIRGNAASLPEDAPSGAVAEGGGIAVGGREARLYFSGTATVQDNTMPSEDETVNCNVYLDQDSNAIINTGGALTGTAFIGVYTSVDQDDQHGYSDMNFGTYKNTTDAFNHFVNDRRPYLQGTQGNTAKNIMWSKPVCKIVGLNANNEWQTLYIDEACTIPAVYTVLEDSGSADTVSAFGMLLNTSPVLYMRTSETKPYNGERYTQNNYQIQMLVREYPATRSINVKNGRVVTLTTASTQPDENRLYYDYHPDYPCATVIRSKEYGSMFKAESGATLTLSSITIDGGYKNNIQSTENGGIISIKGAAKVYLDNNSKLCNSSVKPSVNNSSGGAVRMGEGVNGEENDELHIDGGIIDNCHSGTYGGAVSVRRGVLYMTAGSITNCTSKYAGAVRVDRIMHMSGGSITNNTATVTGGGISMDSGNGATPGKTGVYFSGNAVVKNNHQSNGSVLCNVMLEKNDDGFIYTEAPGLSEGADIGIYANVGNRWLQNYTFGTDRPVSGGEKYDDNLLCFINDRDTSLTGAPKVNTDKIIWAPNPILAITNVVDSTLASDEDIEFKYTVTLLKKTGDTYSTDTTLNFTYDGLKFENGVASKTVDGNDAEHDIVVKAGETQRWALPSTGNYRLIEYGYHYIVTQLPMENFNADQTQTERGDGWTAWSDVMHEYGTDGSISVTGLLGENLTENPKGPSGKSEVRFTNKRTTGSLTVSKTVNSAYDIDSEVPFYFILDINGSSAETLYYTFNKNGAPIDKTLTFQPNLKRATFTLAAGESVTIDDLPTELVYEVRENLTDIEKRTYKTTVQKSGIPASDPDEPSTSLEQSGKIGLVTKSEEDPDTHVETTRETYESTVAYTNFRKGVVCKITNSSDQLVQYKDEDGKPVDAVFETLEEAVSQINRGLVYEGGDPARSGALKLKLLTEEYSLEHSLTLNAKNQNGLNNIVILTTAGLKDTDGYPYGASAYPCFDEVEDDGKGDTAAINRAFGEGSMIVTNCALTLDKILLDGKEWMTNGQAPSVDGGIVHVNGTGTLTLNSDAKLQKSITSGNGGAIYLEQNAMLTMYGEIEYCSATNGGGVYAAQNTRAITLAGKISNCTAEDGGAVYAKAGKAVSVNNGANLVGNRATGNGGAIYSETNVTINGGNIGATEDEKGNSAVNGGGVFMGDSATFTMENGSISGNTTLSGGNGGGLYVQNSGQRAAQIKGGSITGNSADQKGGAVFTATGATLNISGSAQLTDNGAHIGGAIYDQGSIAMSGGKITGNYATVGGGAVYVTGGHSFAMSGGEIKENYSPLGALSTDDKTESNVYPSLVFSGTANVTGNFSATATSDGKVTANTTAMNVFLGYDTNEIIRTPGLGEAASIGVYVKDEDEIFNKHGIAARNFGTYTGSNTSGANLDRFVSDQVVDQTGVVGAKRETAYYDAMWKGEDLNLIVYKIDQDGKQTTDPVPGARFELYTEEAYNEKLSFVESEGNKEPKPIWSGVSAGIDSSNPGLVTIPWGPVEAEDGGVASFAADSSYVLKQTAASEGYVLPAGYWTLKIAADNTITWKTEQQSGNVNRTEEVGTVPSIEGNGTRRNVTGRIFSLYNDVQPVITYDPNGGVLAQSSEINQDGTKDVTVVFGATDTYLNYMIDEPNPTKRSSVFRVWASKKDPGEAGYVEYGDTIRFYRHDKNDDITLYAQWEDVVCKITDRNDRLLYLKGSPAVYMSLEDGFAAFNDYYSGKVENGTTVYFTASPESNDKATPRKIKMLVDSYKMTESVTLESGHTAVLTTASRDDDDIDNYGGPYTGESGSECVISWKDSEDSANGPMIIDNFNLTLTNITLDGDGKTGGIVRVDRKNAQLTIGNGATLKNAKSTYGGAINAIANTTVTVSGGTITGNEATYGGAIYTLGTLRIKAGSITGNEAKASSDGQGGFGGAVYVGAGGSLTMSGGSIGDAPTTEDAAQNANANRAVLGAGVYLASGVKKSTFTGGNIQYNEATQAGGGMFAMGAVDINGLTLANNRAGNDDVAGSGGGVYLQGMDANNKPLLIIKRGVINANAATKNGAGVYVDEYAEMTMTGGSVTGNVAADNGGGVYVGQGGVIHLSKGSIGTSGTGNANTARNGGGVYLAAGSGESTFTGGTIGYNQAVVPTDAGDTPVGNGGGLYTAATITLSGTTVTRNSALNGGGVYVKGGADDKPRNELTLASGVIRANSAAIPTGSSAEGGFGGGVYVDNNGGLIMKGGTIGGTTNSYANHAVNGAGVYLNGGEDAHSTFVLTSGSVMANRATGLGGAVYAQDYAQMTMSGGSITKNRASGTNGGAVNVGGANARLNFYGSPLVFNNPDSASNTAQKNVVLSVDDTGVINTVESGLTGGTIGVYAVDTATADNRSTVFKKHGLHNTPFGRFDGETGTTKGQYVNAFVNDRNLTLYGVTKEGDTTEQIWWLKVVCKLTNSSDALLYRHTTVSIGGVNVSMYVPAVFTKVKAGFDAAASKEKLYRKSGSAYVEYTGDVKLKMLQDYALGNDEIIEYSGASARNITFTTAETDIDTAMKRNGDSYIFSTERTEDADRAIVERGEDNTASMFTVNATGKSLTATKIILDGGAVYDAQGNNTGKSATANGGIVNVAAGELTIADGATLRNSKTTGNGGAVYLAANATAEMTGGAITGCSATDGGAVYLAANATMELKDGKDASNNPTSATINGNTATTAGAGIYLEEDSKLKLSGNPSFGGTGRNGENVDAEIITEKTVGDQTVVVGNFVEGALTDMNNGQKEYKKFRQDIYVSGYLGTVGTGAAATPKPATAIVVTGPITSDAGSIWVAAEKPDGEQANNHYEMLKQFAVFADGVASDEATMHAFRNAWDDETTGCGADYLTGQEGDDLKDEADKTWKCIYWTGGFDFVFRKLDGDGEALDGAKFTLFMAVEDPANSGKFVPAMKNAAGKYVPATSTDEATWAAYEQTDKEKGGKKDATAESKNIAQSDAVKVKYTADGGTNVDDVSVCGKGLAVFEKIPPGVYFMVEKVKKADGSCETGAPLVEGKTMNYQSVEEMYRVVIDGKGWFTIHVADRDANGQPVWDAAVKNGKAYTWPNANLAPTVTLKETASGSKVYTDEGTGTATVDLFTALNASPLSRKVILKKVDGTAANKYTSLSGAKFTVFYADKKTVVRVPKEFDASGKPTSFDVLENKTSGAGGAFFIGKLPYGTYYLHETTVPSGYSSLSGTNDNWFILTVNEYGVGYLGTDSKFTNELNPETSKP